MTKENRERQYKHFRNLEQTYEARDGLNSGPTATQMVRKRAKESADAVLKKHPELEQAPVEEEEKPKTKSKGKK